MFFYTFARHLYPPSDPLHELIRIQPCPLERQPFPQEIQFEFRELPKQTLTFFQPQYLLVRLDIDHGDLEADLRRITF